MKKSEITMEQKMGITTLKNVTTIFNNANDSTNAIRLIMPCYETYVTDSEINDYILDKTVRHFRNKGKLDGVYNLGHELELVLEDHSKIREIWPF
jgi:hypothetical protein